MRDLPLTRLLMGVRMVLARDRARADVPLFDAFVSMGFAVLADAPGEEVVLGVAGRPWRVRGDGLDAVAGPDDFRAYSRPGSVKAAINFALAPERGGTRLTTETRIAGTDEAGRRTFGRYWRIVMPGSALIRREFLRAAAGRAAARPAPAPRSTRSPRSPPPRARTPRR